jgi:dephospho-CoA kinase
VLGVLGGIAAGKSEVARRLAGEDGIVLSADRIAHEVLASPEVTALVEERFGRAVLGPDGRPDRTALAALAFAPGDPERAAEVRKALEGWTHPRVRDRILVRLRDARSDGVPRIVLDVPLLLENDAQHGLARACDTLVFVDAPDDERDRRARATRGWAPGEVARREGAQWPLADKRRRAQHVIPNTQSLVELETRVARLLEHLQH